MKLLYTLNSPYARKVRIVALEKHIDLALQEVDLSQPDNLAKMHNPLGKVPTLVLDDGTALYDSAVIAEFLDYRTPVAHLIPQDHTGRIAVKRWEALADGVCDAAVAMMLEQRKPTELQSASTIEKQLDKVTRGLDCLNADLSKRKWCVNEAFSLADIAVGCALGYFDLRFKHLRWDGQDWQTRFANVGKLVAVLSKRPSFKQTAPKPA